MRLIKMFGLAALAVVAAAAFVGATPTLATSTQLCKAHASLTCAEGQATTSVHMALTEGTVGKLLAAIPILCLGVLVQVEALALGKPQLAHTTTLSPTGCGTGSGHDNCKVTTEEQPLSHLLKTGLDEGILLSLSGRTRLQCTNLGIDCVYHLEGSEFAVGAQHLTANEVPITALGGEFFCPGWEEGEGGESGGSLDGLLKTLHAVTSKSSVLCKTHSSEACAEKDQATSLHMVTTKPPVLYNTIANIECKSSLIRAWAESKELFGAEKLTWKECHTQGAADNCTITSRALPAFDLQYVALNLGTVTTLGLEIEIDCTILGLIELDCVYGSDVALLVEGALHKEGTGHGKFSASKVVLEKLEGEGHCPESVKWEATYEPLEHVYVLGSASLSGEAAYVLQ